LQPSDWSIEVVAIKSRNARMAYLMSSNADFIDDTELEELCFDRNGGRDPVVNDENNDAERDRRSVARRAMYLSRSGITSTTTTGLGDDAPRGQSAAVPAARLIHWVEHASVETPSTEALGQIVPPSQSFRVLEFVVSGEGGPLNLGLGPLANDLTVHCSVRLTLEMQVAGDQRREVSIRVAVVELLKGALSRRPEAPSPCPLRECEFEWVVQRLFRLG
jgi:hypothetical protein